MSDAAMHDTHRYVKDLTNAGLADPIAQVIADREARLLEHNLATKTDIASVQKDIAGLQKEIAGLQKETAELKKETAGLHKDIGAVKQDLSDKAILIIRWNVGTLLAVAGLLLGAIKLL